mgnify:FL=1
MTGAGEKNPFDALILYIAEETVRVAREKFTEQAPAIVAEIKAAIPQEKRPDRLLCLDEVAKRLACSKQRVTQYMASGELVWTVDHLDGDRKVKESWLDSYIKNLPMYTGEKRERRAVGTP